VTTNTIKLHADGDITCKTRWTVQCGKMLKYSLMNTWKSLQEVFEIKGMTSRIMLKTELLSLKHKPSEETLSEHSLKFDKIIRELEVSVLSVYICIHIIYYFDFNLIFQHFSIVWVRVMTFSRVRRALALLSSDEMWRMLRMTAYYKVLFQYSPEDA
jgi:hypothetical protein